MRDNARLILLELQAHELVRSRNPDGAFHARHRLERFQARRHIADAHRANDDAFFAGDRVNFVPELLNPRLGGGNLFLRGMQSH
jgi:hypothetical protein